MKAVRVYEFGGPEVMRFEDVARPVPGEGQVLVRVQAAGVGPWDAWIRAGRSALPQPLPLTLGSDISGTIEELGPGVAHLRPGDAVFGVTNKRFTGAYAEYALAEAAMLAPKPGTLDHIQAASVPVVAVTAWQMVFDHGHVVRGQSVLVHGAAGNVGAYAVRLARSAGASVIATALPHQTDSVRSLGVETVIDSTVTRFEAVAKDVDVVIDTVGGDLLARSYGVVKPGGILVSSVAPPDEARARQQGIRALFFLVEVTTARLKEIARRIDSGELRVKVGEVLPLAQARSAHEMLEGKPHRPGKIVLQVAA